MRYTKYDAIYLSILVLFCLFLYRFVVNLFWHFDDGALLRDAAALSPAQYFFDPVYAAPGGSIAPFLLLWYDLGIGLFGLNPEPLYIVLLVLLAASAALTYLFLRLWIESFFAFIFAAVYCVGAPVLNISAQFMTAHYLMGLIFVLLSSLFFVSAVNKNNLWIAAASAFCYFLSILSKEFYFLAPMLFLFLPVGSMRSRAKFVAFHIVLASVYLAWRWIVFSGHIQSRFLFPSDFGVIAKQFSELPALVFGDGWIGYLGLISYSVLMILAYRKHASPGLVFAALIVLAVPLLPVAGIAMYSLRYLYVSWWSMSVFLGVGLSLVWPRELGKTGAKKFFIIFLVVSVIGAAGMHSFRYKKKFMADVKWSEVMYTWLANSNEKEVWLVDPLFTNYYKYLYPGYLRAESLLAGGEKRRAAIEFDKPGAINPGLDYYVFDADLVAMRKLDRPELIRVLKKRPPGVDIIPMSRPYPAVGLDVIDRPISLTAVGRKVDLRFAVPNAMQVKFIYLASPFPAHVLFSEIDEAPDHSGQNVGVGLEFDGEAQANASVSSICAAISVAEGDGDRDSKVMLLKNDKNKMCAEMARKF